MIQGSIYPDLRRRAVEELLPLPFSGFALGGNMVTFGESIKALASEKPVMWQTVAFTCSLLPLDKPRHLLGVGEPADLIEGVRSGIDTFDCVMATRIARHGSAWIRTNEPSWQFERIDLAAARWTTDQSSLDPRCDCLVCTDGYQRGFLRHLVKIHDPLALSLLSLHNLRQLERLTVALRQAILDGTFDETFPQP
jgi:queuine tRNA-ribosyltransferase